MSPKSNFLILLFTTILIACNSHTNNNKSNDVIAKIRECNNNLDSDLMLSSDTLNVTILNMLKYKNYECAYFLANNRNDSDFNSLLINTLTYINIDSLNRAKHEVKLLNNIEVVECNEEISSFFYKLITYEDENIYSRRSFIDVFIRNYYSDNPNDMCELFSNSKIEEGYDVEIEDY